MSTNIAIDEKDRKILAQLDDDARQSDSEIAKKVGLSKQVVNYRIQKLVEQKIITNFYSIINVGSLGLNSYYVFLQLEKINKQQEKEILEKLKNLDYVGWLIEGTGRWDVILTIYADSVSMFDKLLTQTLSLCENHIHEYSFTIQIQAEHISYPFLNKDSREKGVKQTEKLQQIQLDHTDKKIIEKISQHGRMNAVELSAKTKTPLHVTRYHLKELIKTKTILGFKPKIDVNKLGFQWYLLLIQFQTIDEKRKHMFINFCKHNKKIYYVTNTIGQYNLMLDVHVKNIEEFKEVLFELKENFSDVIKVYESIIIFEEYKIDYFPKELIK